MKTYSDHNEDCSSWCLLEIPEDGDHEVGESIRICDGFFCEAFECELEMICWFSHGEHCIHDWKSQLSRGRSDGLTESTTAESYQAEKELNDTEGRQDTLPEAHGCGLGGKAGRLVEIEVEVIKNRLIEWYGVLAALTLIYTILIPASRVSVCWWCISLMGDKRVVEAYEPLLYSRAIQYAAPCSVSKVWWFVVYLCSGRMSSGGFISPSLDGRAPEVEGNCVEGAKGLQRAQTLHCDVRL